MPDPVVLYSKDPEENVENWWDGTCPNCEEPLDEPDMEGLHLAHGEFVAITQKCACGLKIESFYDWDRTERKVRDE